MRYTYTKKKKKKCYLKFWVNWVCCIFICYILQTLPDPTGNSALWEAPCRPSPTKATLGDRVHLCPLSLLPCASLPEHSSWNCSPFPLSPSTQDYQ